LKILFCWWFLDTLKELFLTDIIPGDRKLKPFSQVRKVGIRK